MTDEESRHQCEVRQVLRWRRESKNKAVDYLERVAAARGEAARKMIEADCRKQWEKGNRGEKGDWR